MKRRDLLRAGAASATLAFLPVSVREALALAAPTGGLETIEHVVIFMQENRSFDHYFGTLRGVRGFNDPTAITLPGGKSVLYQPSTAHTDGHVLPYPVSDQFMADVAHGWGDGHNAWNGGRHDRWVQQKGVRTMTYHRRDALPFYHALADAFTICDNYRCSVMGATNPNRMYLFTGMIGNEPNSSQRATGNDAWQNLGHTGYTWTTYAERLETAGKSWKVYQEWDNYGDNSLDYFASFLAVGRKALAKTKDSAGKAFTKLEFFYYAVAKAAKPEQDRLLGELGQGLATLTTAERRLYDRGLHRGRPDSLVNTFRADVNGGTLPAVSWIVAPEPLTEHPAWGPNTGADLTKRLLDAIASKPEVWNKTLTLIMYDEDGGFYDHLPPPAPPKSSADGLSTVAITDEITLDVPIGLGERVPMIVISPWSRGGTVCSQSFDHSSVVQFLEKWTGVAEPNISPWRRAVCGDLTSALDLTTANVGYPPLPAPVPTSGQWNTSPQPPAKQVVPVQEPGVRPARPLPYVLTASGRVAADKFWIDFDNTGSVGAHFYVHANAFRTDGPWRYTVEAGKKLSDYWQAGTPTGAYDLTVSGPNGFLRRFAGNRVTATTSGKANPEVTLAYAPSEGKVYLTMTNSGSAACVLTATVNNRGGGPWTYPVAAGASTSDWFSVGYGLNGWYDVTVTSADGFLRRFAGRMETGTAGTSDPVMGSVALPRTVTFASSQETSAENGAAVNAVDGKPDTKWHTKWSGGADPLPHELRLDLGSTRTVTGLTYLPRQDGGANGRIGKYELYLSTDGSTWGTAVATGTFADDATLKTVRCWPTQARHVRLRALTEAGGRGQWTSAAEVTPIGW